MCPAPRAPIFVPTPTPIAGISGKLYTYGVLALERVLSTGWVRVQHFENVAPNVAPNVAAVIQQKQSLTSQVQQCNKISLTRVYGRARAAVRAAIIISCCTVAFVFYLFVFIQQSMQQSGATSVQRFLRMLHLAHNPLETFKKGEI